MSRREDKGKERETYRPPSYEMSAQRRRRASPYSGDDRRGRLYERGPRGYDDDDHRRRARFASWVFARNISAVTHDETCPKCTEWIAHRATARTKNSYFRALELEESYWVGFVEDKFPPAREPVSPPQKKSRRTSPSESPPQHREPSPVRRGGDKWTDYANSEHMQAMTAKVVE